MNSSPSILAMVNASRNSGSSRRRRFSIMLSTRAGKVAPNGDPDLADMGPPVRLIGKKVDISERSEKFNVFKVPGTTEVT